MRNRIQAAEMATEEVGVGLKRWKLQWVRSQVR